jgi:hypothetical protein
MCGKDSQEVPQIPLYCTVDDSPKNSGAPVESDIALVESIYGRVEKSAANEATSPSSIFDIDCPLVMTREENEFRLAMKEKMAQSVYRGMEAEFKVPVVSARMEFDTSESIGVVNVSQVKPATNEELGLKFDSTKASDADPADIPDAEHPYQDETIYFTPEGQSIELPIDYRWKTLQVPDSDCPWGGTKPPPMPPVESDAMPEGESPIARDGICVRIKILESRFDELLKGVQAYNEKIADLISDVEFLKADNSALTGKLYQHDSALALLGKELAELRKASETKLSSVNVEGGNPPTGFFSVGGKSFFEHDNSIQPPSFPAGREKQPSSTPAGLNQAKENWGIGTPGAVSDPSMIHPRRFIAHKDTVIDTARCGEFTTSNPAFTADMLNAGKDWYSGAYRQFPKVTERHRIFNERAAVIAQESIPLCRAVEYIILGDEMYDPVSFNLNSYLKGDGKFLRPLDRAQSICIAIDWLRVELSRLRHERLRDEAGRIVAEGE